MVDATREEALLRFTEMVTDYHSQKLDVTRMSARMNRECFSWALTDFLISWQHQNGCNHFKSEVCLCVQCSMQRLHINSGLMVLMRFCRTSKVNEATNRVCIDLMLEIFSRQLALLHNFNCNGNNIEPLVLIVS